MNSNQPTNEITSMDTQGRLAGNKWRGFPKVPKIRWCHHSYNPRHSVIFPEVKRCLRYVSGGPVIPNLSFGGTGCLGYNFSGFVWIFIFSSQTNQVCLSTLLTFKTPGNFYVPTFLLTSLGRIHRSEFSMDDRSHGIHGTGTLEPLFHK